MKVGYIASVAKPRYFRVEHWVNHKVRSEQHKQRTPASSRALVILEAPSISTLEKTGTNPVSTIVLST
jgi:hypothetical protein